MAERFLALGPIEQALQIRSGFDALVPESIANKPFEIPLRELLASLRMSRHTINEVNEVQRGKNRNKSKIRARAEHVFAVVKRLWGFTRVRYRGLERKPARRSPLALANVCLSRRLLMALVRP